MSEPPPTYAAAPSPATNATYPDVELSVQRPELMDAYRAAVSTAHLLEVALNIPQEKRLVMTRKQRRAMKGGE